MQLRLLFTVLFFFTSIWLWSQDKPKGKFLKDKVKVGEPVRYTLSFKYPIGQDILFPDSAYPFTPFEFVEKKYFNTVSDSSNSFDSVVYTLATFDIDSTQHLALPILLIENEDTTKIFATPDSILLIPTVTFVPDTIKLFENANYVRVDKEINYNYILIGLSIFLLVVVFFVLVFGKTILKRLKVNRLRKQYYKFLVSFKEMNSSIDQSNYEQKLLELYSLWKKYLQQVTEKPFPTYSTKEINKLILDDRLKESLILIDRGIYAHRFPDNIGEVSKPLLEVAQKLYNNKSLEVKHGSKK